MCSIIPTNSSMFFSNISLEKGMTELPEVLLAEDAREERIQSRSDSTSPAFTEEVLIAELKDKRLSTYTAIPVVASTAATVYLSSKVAEKAIFPDTQTYIYVGAQRNHILNPALETIMHARSVVPYAIGLGCSLASTLFFLHGRSKKAPPQLQDAYAKGAGIGNLRITRLQKKIELVQGLIEGEEDETLKRYYQKCFKKMSSIYNEVVTKRQAQSNEYETGFFLKRTYRFTETGTFKDGSPSSFSALK